MVDLQSTNRTKLSRVREVTFGITPANPAFRTMRVTGEPNLGVKPTTVVSAEIRSDRQVSDLILTEFKSAGDIDGELAFLVHDDSIEEVLQGTWAANPNIVVVAPATEISALSTTTATVASPLGTPFVAGMLVLATGFTAVANNNITPRVASSSPTTIVFPASTFTVDAAPIVGSTLRVVGFQGASGDLVAAASGLTSTALDFTTLGLQAGMWLKIGGTAAGNQFANATLNDFVRVSVIAAHVLTFDRLPVGWTTDAGTSKTLQVFMGDFLINASTKRSNTIERQYLDHSPVSYEYLPGQTLDKMVVTVDAGKIATFTRSYMGAAGSVTTTRVAGATDIAAPANKTLNAASNVGRIGFAGATILGPNFVMGCNFSFVNNLRQQMAVGQLGAAGIGNGEFTVTGQLNTYFGDKTVLDKIMNNTLASFDIRFGRADGNNESLVFDFPSIKLSSGEPTVTGKNQDVMILAGFQAFRDATLGYTASVGRFFYLP